MISEATIAQLLKPGTIIPLGLIGMGFYYLIQKFGGQDEYEDVDVEDVTQDHLREELRNAESVDYELLMQVENGVNTRGNVVKYGEDAMPGSDAVSPVPDPEMEDEEPDEVDADEALVKLQVRPADTSKWMYWIKDKILNSTEASDYYILKTENVRMDQDRLVIKKGAHLDYHRGIFKDRSQAAANKANQVIRLGQDRQIVEGVYNYGRRVMHLDPDTTVKEELEKIRNQQENDDLL